MIELYYKHKWKKYMYKIAKNFPQLQFESNTTMMAKYYPQKNHTHTIPFFF
jgi:hypothetical protein